ncbi:MAG: uncharacterized protein K0Q92_633 [Steroidobacteraceae bacterium]|jgi:hypothetical protein|nr:uncharacterized protein [Steroidobacteraceae bacterium]
MNDEKFWIIWNPRGHAPTQPHSSYESAVAEAQRLAKGNQGHVFYVLEATEAFECVSVKRTVLLHPMPF